FTTFIFSLLPLEEFDLSSAMESNSSKKITVLGSTASNCSFNFVTAPSTSELAKILLGSSKKLKFRYLAISCAQNVFPHPGAPKSIIPPGGLNPHKSND